MAEEAATEMPETAQSDSADQSESVESEDIKRLEKALAAERKLRSAAERRIEELVPKEQGYNERITALENELKGERVKSGKTSVAADKGVPFEALSGDTPEEWEAAAERILAWRAEQEKTNKPARPATSSGLKSGATGTDSRLDGKDRAAAALRAMRQQ